MCVNGVVRKMINVRLQVERPRNPNTMDYLCDCLTLATVATVAIASSCYAVDDCSIVRAEFTDVDVSALVVCVGGLVWYRDSCQYLELRCLCVIKNHFLKHSFVCIHAEVQRLRHVTQTCSLDEMF
jgi:hypothetical protein